LRGSSLMPPSAVLGLIAEGLTSNFWGLGCPLYCTQPSYGLLGFSLLFGWLCGVLCCVLLVWWISTLGLVSVGFSPSSARSPALTSRARLLAS
jgi:hypothetical protein